MADSLLADHRSREGYQPGRLTTPSSSIGHFFLYPPSPYKLKHAHQVNYKMRVIIAREQL